MNNFKQVFLLIFLSLLCAEILSAQPERCSATFDPLRTCNSDYISKEFVFVGRIISTDEKLVKKNNGDDWLWRVRVAVSESLKGNLGNRAIELFLDIQCRGTVERGHKYIFTADHLRKVDFNGLVSSRWSTSLNDISKDGLTNLLRDIRSTIKGKKQSRIVGKIIQYDSNPLAIHDFQGKSLNTKMGYNPQFSSPLKGVEIIAKPADEKLNPLNRLPYKTRSNSDGSYEFRDLPLGFYELSLTLSQKFDIRAHIYITYSYGESSFELIQGQKAYLRVDKGTCSKDVRFNVRLAHESKK